jgi:DNA adenine methylase
LSDRPRAFIRWAGSKRSLLRSIAPYLPQEYGRYYEPFLGSGSLFFLLQPRRATLSDSCADLISLYQAVARYGIEVLRFAEKFEFTPECYYQARRRKTEDPVEAAGTFLYLNKACFNGLYRVNLAGQFNVPYGRPRTAFIADEENLIQCQRVLRRSDVRLVVQDFERTLARCKTGDLVFLDPPYVTRHNNNGFLHYNEQLFSWSDQMRLADVANDLAERGCHVYVTNAAHGDVAALYIGFETIDLTRNSALASAIERRGPVLERLFIRSPARARSCKG